MELYGHVWNHEGYGLKLDGEELWEYKKLIQTLHPDITWIYEEDDSYQGEFFACGFGKDEWWYFIQGWFGSCSGCDWLQGVSSEEDIRELLTYYKKVVIAKEYKSEIISYMNYTLQNVGYDAKKTLSKLIEKVQNFDKTVKEEKEC